MDRLRRMDAWHYTLPVAVFLLGISPILPTLARGLWGPADPFLNGDFNGGWWMWWAASEWWRGTDWTASLAYPNGAVSLARVIPNPTDMLVLGLAGPPTPLKWNLVQIVHVLATLVAGVRLARVAGASRFASAAAFCVVAGSPVMLHELAGGRPSNLIVWPGLLSLACLLQSRARASGLWAALQGLLYLWHGVVLIVVGLVLVKDWRVARRAALWGGMVFLPYLAWLFWGNGGLPNQPPPAGYTALPLSGLWGLDVVPERFRVHPLLVPVALLALKGHKRWLVSAGVGLLVAVGPWPTWALGELGLAGPMAWVNWAIPPLERMHHPVRATLIALPVLAVALALGLDGFSKGRWVGVALVVVVVAKPGQLHRVATYDSAAEIPFADKIPDGQGPVIDLLGMDHRAALSLQTVHQRALAEPLLFRRSQEGIQAGLQDLSEGKAVDEAFWESLRELGFKTLFFFDRFGKHELSRRQIEETLGKPESEGVYSLERR